MLNSVDDKEEKIGPFPSWKALYAAVVLYTLLVIGLLYLMTVFFDYSLS